MRYVILIHGLWKTSFSMRRLARALKRAGFVPLNRTYPYGWHGIIHIAGLVDRLARKRGCYEAGAELNIVTHSAGALVARAYAAFHKPANLRRIVMIAPPNQGAELADMLRGHPFWGITLNRGAGREIGVAGIQRMLPRMVDAEVGVIAGGTGGQKGFLSLLPGDNDGRVTVESTRLEGAKDFILLRYKHTYMPAAPEVIRRTIEFLKDGRFGGKEGGARAP